MDQEMDSAAERQKANLRPKPLLSGIPKLPTLVSIPMARSRLLPHHLLYRFHGVLRSYKSFHQLLLARTRM